MPTPPQPCLELLTCLAQDRLGQARALVEDPAFDVDALERFCARNQVGGYIHLRLEEAGLAPRHPVMERLQERRRRQEKSCERNRARLAEVAAAFAAARCDVVLHKGLYLAERFYGAPHLRTSWDLDLLVRHRDRERARDVLLAAGFERSSPVLLGETLSSRFAHGFDYMRGAFKVDLHWALSGHPAIRFDYDRMLDEAPLTEVVGVEVRVLSDDALLAALLVSAFEDLQRGGLRLRTFVDLQQVLARLEAATDWEAFFARRRAEGVEAICAAVLHVFAAVFSTSELFPALDAALDARPRSRPDAALQEALLSAAAPGLRGRIRAWSLYDAGLPSVFAWWCVSLPFRVVVHRKPRTRAKKTAIASAC
ncbi:MAG: nucleotidyltransferase family protein [Thermoanaerobaculia bacterium]|nr:nucleotidyltransferase family protein [Thermoanaerobaculia bacterium]